MNTKSAWRAKASLCSAWSTFLLISILVLVTSCGLSTAHTTAPHQVNCQTQGAHLDPIWLQYDPDITASMPQEYVHQANHLIASWLEGLPRIGGQGGQFLETVISSKPYAPESTKLTVSIPAIGDLPPCPSRSGGASACSMPDANPYSCKHVQATAETQYGSATDTYNAAVTQLNAKVEAARKELNPSLVSLRQQNFGVDRVATSIYGCLDLAAQRFAGKPGRKYVLLATDGQNNSDVDRIPLRLDGISVWFIFFVAPNGRTAQATQAYWTDVLSQAHAADVRFFDPGASASLVAPWDKSS